ncbi:MAG: methyltransferase domain-containing protein [Acidimicrobiia bacterium]|nr:methyltransferase domain-containing protein [Acidimicrobiia bacterium]MYB43993.1 methyltransferase domain-containing protein [Acidimicrobiia bacterium]MYC86578.1 methyltransferase domain-containing protein [Acidimicrobiia bacterium]
MRSTDPDLLKEYALKIWHYKQGEVVSLMVHLGDRLGLYQAMAGGEELTSGELAERTGLSERWVREWLLGQAAAGLIERAPDVGFSLSAEGEEVLVNDDALAFSAGAFIGGLPPERIQEVVDAFHTGIGVTYHQLGEPLARQVDRMNKAWVGAFLVERVLPCVDGLVGMLEAGCRVAEVGSGGGITVRTLAERFPASTVDGYEPSGIASSRARHRIRGLPNATIHRAGGEELADDGRYDLVLALDCMHDVPFPDRIAAAVRHSLKDDGVWLIKDMHCSDVFEDNLKNPMLAMLYGYSLSACLLSATSEEGAAGLGTVGFHPVEAERIIREAGFSAIREFRLKEDPTHNYYEVRP